MSTSARSAVRLFLAAGAVAAWGIGIAAPAVAAPGDSVAAGPTTGDSTVPSLPISTLDGLWNQFVPPNPIVAPNPIGRFDRFVGQFVPTSIDLASPARDFLQYFEQFRPPAPITAPTR